MNTPADIVLVVPTAFPRSAFRIRSMTSVYYAPMYCWIDVTNPVRATQGVIWMDECIMRRGEWADYEPFLFLLSLWDGGIRRMQAGEGT